MSDLITAIDKLMQEDMAPETRLLLELAKKAQITGGMPQIPETNPYESEDYQRYVVECAKHCECSRDICESVLAGAPCEMRIEEDY